jgi:hypothetical protein
VKAAIVKERLQNQEPRAEGLSQFLPASPQKAVPNPTYLISFIPELTLGAITFRSSGAFLNVFFWSIP